jgi:hypothetical protein
VAAGADLVLEPTGTGVKETIVLDGPASPRVWRFPLHLHGLTATVDPVSGHVLFTPAAATEATAMVPHGWMTDAAYGTHPDEAASYSEAVTYTLEEGPEGPVLVVSLDDPGWMTPTGCGRCRWIRPSPRSTPVPMTPT